MWLRGYAKQTASNVSLNSNFDTRTERTPTRSLYFEPVYPDGFVVSAVSKLFDHNQEVAMVADNLHSFRFATDAQWNACLFAQADRDPARTSEGIGPFAPYARPAQLYESHGAHAPVVTH